MSRGLMIVLSRCRYRKSQHRPGFARRLWRFDFLVPCLASTDAESVDVLVADDELVWMT